MTIISNEKLNELIDYLQGTCMSLNKACNDLGFSECDLTNKQIESIEEQYTQCDGCGWWIESLEITDDGCCSDCSEEN